MQRALPAKSKPVAFHFRIQDRLCDHLYPLIITGPNLTSLISREQPGS